MHSRRRRLFGKFNVRIVRESSQDKVADWKYYIPTADAFGVCYGLYLQELAARLTIT